MAESFTSVPDELMRELHRATERFHTCRQELEKWMDATAYRHEERVTAAIHELRDAERAVEAIEAQTKDLLPSSHAAAASTTESGRAGSGPIVGKW